MRIFALKDIDMGGVKFEGNKIAQVSDEVGLLLIRAGVAELAKPAATKKAAPKKKKKI